MEYHTVIKLLTCIPVVSVSVHVPSAQLNHHFWTAGCPIYFYFLEIKESSAVLQMAKQPHSSINITGPQHGALFLLKRVHTMSSLQLYFGFLFEDLYFLTLAYSF